jgi:hypothetical protein
MHLKPQQQTRRMMIRSSCSERWGKGAAKVRRPTAPRSAAATPAPPAAPPIGEARWWWGKRTRPRSRGSRARHRLPFSRVLAARAAALDSPEASARCLTAWPRSGASAGFLRRAGEASPNGPRLPSVFPWHSQATRTTSGMADNPMKSTMMSARANSEADCWSRSEGITRSSLLFSRGREDRGGWALAPDGRARGGRRAKSPPSSPAASCPAHHLRRHIAAYRGSGIGFFAKTIPENCADRVVGVGKISRRRFVDHAEIFE